MLELLLYAFAFVCFVLAAIGVGAGRFNLIGAGLALWVAAVLFAGAGAHHLVH